MERKPKILHITTTAARRNGVGQIVHTLRSAADRYGMDSAIVAGYGARQDSEYVLENRWAYRLNALRSRLFVEDGFLGGPNNRKLEEIVGEYRPDLVHIHNLHGYYCDIVSLDETLKKHDIPAVVTFHDLWLTTGRCAHPPGGSCSEWTENGCRNCPLPKRYPAKWIGGNTKIEEKKEFLRDKTVVVPSHWMAGKASKFIAPVNIIPNGVDIEVFRPFSGVKKNKGEILAVATQWSGDKGIDEIVGLADKLPAGYTVNLIGNGVPQHSRIRNIGYIGNETELARMMASAQALISASHEESFGLTVAEALAVGTPAIVQKDTAPAELLVDKSFAVNFSDAKEVIEALDRLDDYEMPLRIASSADMAHEYYALYKKILN